MDLRLVAQIYGTLYGGPLVGVILTFVNIGYRSFFEGPGVITTLVIAPLHLILILIVIVRRRFMNLTTLWKVHTILLVGLVSSILTLSNY